MPLPTLLGSWWTSYMSDTAPNAEIVKPPFMLAADAVIELHYTLGTGNHDDDESLWAEVDLHDTLSRQSGSLAKAAQQFDFASHLDLSPVIIEQAAADLHAGLEATTVPELRDIYTGLYADRLGSILGIEVDETGNN